VPFLLLDVPCAMSTARRLKAIGRLVERTLDRLDPAIELVTGNLWLDRLVFRRKQANPPRRRVHLEADGNVLRVQEPTDPTSE
jgi:hypothetical protein